MRDYIKLNYGLKLKADVLQPTSILFFLFYTASFPNQDASKLKPLSALVQRQASTIIRSVVEEAQLRMIGLH